MPFLTTKTKHLNKDAKMNDNLEYVSVFIGHSEDRITIDNYEAFGESLKQRESTQIEVYQNGKLLFRGDKYELFEILENATKDKR